MDRTYIIDAVIEPVDLMDEKINEALATTPPYLTMAVSDGLYTLTGDVTAPSPEEAKRQFCATAKHAGLHISRFQPEFVTIADIARRTSASEQTVRYWVSGERGEDFPPPYMHAGNRALWDWYSVYHWIKNRAPRGNAPTIKDIYDVEPLSPELLTHATHHAMETTAAEARSQMNTRTTASPTGGRRGSDALYSYGSPHRPHTTYTIKEEVDA